MKSVLISIQPKWCELIASGKKTVEVRKTCPKFETPFKCYIYCTKAKEHLVGTLKDGDENYGEIYHGKPVFIKIEDGSMCDMYGKRQKVIGEFVCNKICKIQYRMSFADYDFQEVYALNDKEHYFSLSSTGLMQSEIIDYGKGKTLYGWHISDLKIYDKPKELGEFRRPQPAKCSLQKYTIDNTRPCSVCRGCTIRRPPQSWCYVEENNG